MEKIQKILSRLPHAPGVYLYRNSRGQVIYVGKAVDLSRRVRQYFQSGDNQGPKTQQLVKQISNIEIKQTINEFDALLLEAHLIQKYLPKYNIIAKDDKSPLYIKITVEEKLPRILYVRKNALGQEAESSKAEIFGPFQSSRTVKSLLSRLRRVVPYCTQRQRNGKPCFYTHLGLCQNCPSQIALLPDSANKVKQIKAYRLQIFRLIRILRGQANLVISQLEKDMATAARNLEFENATIIRNHINNLYAIIKNRSDPEVYINDLSHLEDTVQLQLNSLNNILSSVVANLPKKLKRIECIDISNTVGIDPAGSLVVLIDGIPDTSKYRRFKVRDKNTPDDYAMMSEVLSRRFQHLEWPLPDLLIVDGGRGQLKQASIVLNKLNIHLPVIGLAKRQEKIIYLAGDRYKSIGLPLNHPAVHILQRVRDEAHRFAITYHRLLRGRSFLNRNT